MFHKDKKTHDKKEYYALKNEIERLIAKVYL